MLRVALLAVLPPTLLRRTRDRRTALSAHPVAAEPRLHVMDPLEFSERLADLRKLSAEVLLLLPQRSLLRLDLLRPRLPPHEPF